MSFIVFRESLGLENLFNGLVDELWESRRILTQEWYYFDLVWVVYLFFEHSYLLYDLKPFHYRLLDAGG